MSRVRESYVFEGGGDGIDTDKAGRWGIGRLWYEASDPVASADSLAAARRRGIQVGLKLNGTGSELAAAMDKTLREHGFGSTTGPYGCGAMFDDERHQPYGTIELLKAWRALRPTRYTILTVEPFQGSSFPVELVQLINRDTNLLLAVQDYIDDHEGDQLYPAWPPAALDELELAGIRRERLTSFIAVKAGVQIPYGWAGILYGFAGLPSSPPIPL